MRFTPAQQAAQLTGSCLCRRRFEPLNTHTRSFTVPFYRKSFKRR